MGNPVAVLREGHLIQVANPRTIYRHPADADLARFVGEAVLVPGLAKDGRVECHLGHLKLAGGMPEGAVEVLIRPEQIRLVSTADEGAIPARIETVTFYGHDATVHLSLVADPLVKITARIAGFRAPRPDEQVNVAVDGAVVTYPRG